MVMGEKKVGDAGKKDYNCQIGEINYNFGQFMQYFVG